MLKKGDIASVISRKQAPLESFEEEFEPMPNSLARFFTVHEFMGRKSWCTKDNGKMLGLGDLREEYIQACCEDDDDDSCPYAEYEDDEYLASVRTVINASVRA